ncbi:hypothetical protein HAV15_010662 [Penicillium sp. str. |uniref:Uncharacterized protein n=3 Tax=Penicillium TaxID=5073 RepID=A0A9W4NME9_9EURO|nr:hypothetical protein HAV15_010662 [Penicillium sp. str. \
MPNPDPLQPPVTPAERKIINEFGGWLKFMACYGLDPLEQDEATEGKEVLEAMVKQNSMMGKP